MLKAMVGISGMVRLGGDQGAVWCRKHGHAEIILKTSDRG